MDKNTLFSSFGKWIAPICTRTFTDWITETQQDKYVKKLTTAAYLKLFLHAQLQGREGLRHIADDVLCKAFQRELGLTSISAAQLSRKHKQVDSELLQQVFERLVKRIFTTYRAPAHRSKIKLIDSTTVALCLQKYKWATFRKTKAGIKLHMRLAFVGEEDVIPEKATLTNARKNDRTQLDELVDEPGVTYVFDRGYIDYSAFNRYCDNKIYFVTRLKSNAFVEPMEAFEIPQGSSIHADMLVRVGSQQKKMKNLLRMVQTEDSQGNLLFLITNRFDLTCDEIGDMYRSRWAIETFFKWMKQHLRIKHFHGQSDRAVYNQIWIALIAFCLLLLVKLETKVNHSLLQLSRWLTKLMWQPYAEWLQRMKQKPSRVSLGRRRKTTVD
ncbi:IS4 family transposase [Paenibacillus cellulosilyticus]|uniref:IS4 family transposase n=1 Tax=Paenibacillus cellulosilyticus TaxID=375489 RepID=UPI0015802E87|nr:IS4 family transposase [Paenibacillus cellulosilyticus]QKS45216.1 IS4 family transposase [Paenibacillus cellulosilyticus]